MALTEATRRKWSGTSRSTGAGAFPGPFWATAGGPTGTDSHEAQAATSPSKAWAAGRPLRGGGALCYRSVMATGVGRTPHTALREAGDVGARAGRASDMEALS